MNKSQINQTSWMLSILFCIIVFFIFLFSMINFHQKSIIENEIEFQKDQLKKILIVKTTIKEKFKDFTTLTPKDKYELKLLITNYSNICSISIINKGHYIYTTFGGHTPELYKNKVVDQSLLKSDAFILKTKSSLTNKPIIYYILKINKDTYFKIYLKPFIFDLIKKIGTANVTILGFNIHKLNNKLQTEPKSINYKFIIDDLDILFNPNYKLIVSSLAKYYSLKLVGSLIALFFLSIYLFNTIKNKLMIRQIKKNKIEPFIQPIVDNNGKIIGGEVLARWIDSKKSIISPIHFIPYLLKNNITNILTYSLIEQFNEKTKDLDINNLRVSFNLTEKCLLDQKVYAACKKLAPRCNLILEFTETSLFSHKDVSKKMEEYRSHNIKFAVDDYGTGCSSLEYLIDYRFDYLKIDKCFIDGIGIDNRSSYIIECISTLAKKLEIELIPEGIEYKSQRKALDKFNFKYYQGFLFHKPSDINNFIKKVIPT